MRKTKNAKHSPAPIHRAISSTPHEHKKDSIHLEVKIRLSNAFIGIEN